MDDAVFICADLRSTDLRFWIAKHTAKHTVILYIIQRYKLKINLAGVFCALNIYSIKIKYHKEFGWKEILMIFWNYTSTTYRSVKFLWK